MSLQFLNFKPVFLIDMVSYLLLAYFNYLVFLGTIIQLNLTIQQWSSAYIIMEILGEASDFRYGLLNQIPKYVGEAIPYPIYSWYD